MQGTQVPSLPRALDPIATTKTFQNSQKIVFFLKKNKIYMTVKVAQSCPTLAGPMDYTVHGILQNTGVGSRFLIQGIFPTQGSNWGLLHCRWILYQPNYQGSPKIYTAVWFSEQRVKVAIESKHEVSFHCFSNPSVNLHCSESWTCCSIWTVKGTSNTFVLASEPSVSLVLLDKVKHKVLIISAYCGGSFIPKSAMYFFLSSEYTFAHQTRA